ncbi:MAG TPA: hypothetical protein PKZ97_09090, partial [Azospirillaceae bacterium]|nr:hypothetical protein [Azospirillaceae bacterium]
SVLLSPRLRAARILLVADAAARLMTDPALYRHCSLGALAFAADVLSWDAIAAGVEQLVFDLDARLAPLGSKP